MEKVIWLTSLVFSLSMFARGTYVAGTDQVESPEDLRRFNELIHRVATYQMRVVNDSPEGLPDAALFEMLAKILEDLRVNAQVLASLP